MRRFVGFALLALAFCLVAGAWYCLVTETRGGIFLAFAAFAAFIATDRCFRRTPVTSSEQAEPPV